MAQACGRVMQPGSSIINISSVLGLTTGGPPPGGVLLLEGGADRAYPRPGPAVDRPQGHPGQRHRPRLLRLRDDRAVPAWLPRVQQGRIPTGRKGDPAELAATVVFLASDAAGYITGQTLAVDGGMTIT